MFFLARLWVGFTKSGYTVNVFITGNTVSHPGLSLQNWYTRTQKLLVPEIICSDEFYHYMRFIKSHYFSHITISLKLQTELQVLISHAQFQSPISNYCPHWLWQFPYSFQYSFLNPSIISPPIGAKRLFRRWEIGQTHPHRSLLTIF